MPTNVGPNTFGDENLVFGYDLSDAKNSYIGQPVDNYIWHQNAVAQASYTPYSATSSGTWNAKHPRAIRAYRSDGGDITGYVNTGVGDWTNTYHAIWEYDPELGKPVVVMNDRDGQWKAKSYGTGMGSWASYGKGHGDTYTISWLQWVDHLSKNAKAGVYCRTPEGNYGFHDGQANSATAYNTKLYTWQRVYQTYTTSTARNINDTYSAIYMYGHYNVRGTVKIADVQFNWGSYPMQYSPNSARSNTQGLLDLTGNSTIDLTNVSFDSNAQMTFDGTDDYAALSGFVQPSNPNNFTVEAVVKLLAHNAGTNIGSVIVNNYSSLRGWIFFLNGPSSFLGLRHHNESNPGGYNVVYGTGINLNQWYHIAATDDGVTVRLYINGVQVTSGSSGPSVNYAGQPIIGQFGGGYAVTNGSIPYVRIFDRALTASEVASNYKAIKGRFNI